jgi:hypothetical protein
VQEQLGRAEVVSAVANVQHTAVLLAFRSPPAEVFLQNLQGGGAGQAAQGLV